MRIKWNPPQHNLNGSRHSWSVDYATEVHEGATRRDGSTKPARPWTEYASQHLSLDNVGDRFDESGIDSIVKAIAEQFDHQCREAIEATMWQWDRVTHRSNGQVVGSPRDIVDTGALRDSQSYDFT